MYDDTKIRKLAAVFLNRRSNAKITRFKTKGKLEPYSFTNQSLKSAALFLLM